MNNYLKHYGVLGMKWGVRRYQPYPKGEGQKGKKSGVRRKLDDGKTKKRLSIRDDGLLTWGSKPASRKGKINFTIRTLVSIGLLSSSIYISKNPEIVHRGVQTVNKMTNKTVSQIVPKAKVDSGIFSKELNRMLSIKEALELGF